MFSNNRRRAVLALIIANIIWGAASPIFKLALENIPPFTLAFIRFFGGTLILFPFTLNSPWISRKHWPYLVLLSLFGISINITFFFFGLKLAPSINAPVIASSGPIFLYLLSITLLHEKAHRKILLGTLVSLLGVLVVVGTPILTAGKASEILGNLFFIAATMGGVGHALISKKIIEKYNAVTITFWSFLIGSLTFLPFFIYELYTSDPFSTLDERGILGIVFGILLSSVVAYVLYEWGLKKLSAQEIGVFTYIDPLAAIILANILLNETVTPLFLVGSLFIFGGIFIAEGRIHYHPIHKLRR